MVYQTQLGHTMPFIKNIKNKPKQANASAHMTYINYVSPINSSDAHCCRMGTAIKHPVLPDRVKPSFVIFDIWALWRSVLSVRVTRCQKLQMTAQDAL